MILVSLTSSEHPIHIHNVSRHRMQRASWMLLAALGLSGCTTLPNGHGWGQDVTVAPGWERVRESAVHAASDPWVWAPLAGAAVTQVDHFDRRISNWARHETPVFGSQSNATTWSNELRSAAVAADVATVLLTPSGERGASWLVDKAKGYAVDLVAATVAVETTSGIKDIAPRMRPNGSGDDSFPSGHAATASSYTRLATLNLDQIEMNETARTALDVGLQAIDFGTAWARVEGGWHYPSDTLVSIAIGNFCGIFFNDAFMGLDTSRTRVSVAPLRGGGLLLVQMSFGD
jgi:membrane-associated phospholipid phosphatase